jgi:hypothetical protein
MEVCGVATGKRSLYGMNPELLIRLPKSGSNWGRNELVAYNIAVESQDASTFF